jgi:hypothetical protein
LTDFCCHIPLLRNRRDDIPFYRTRLVGAQKKTNERKGDLEMRGDANNAMGKVSELPARLEAKKTLPPVMWHRTPHRSLRGAQSIRLRIYP